MSSADLKEQNPLGIRLPALARATLSQAVEKSFQQNGSRKAQPKLVSDVNAIEGCA